MIDGEPGTAFTDEVVVRRLRFAAEDTGFAVVDADREGDDVVLVGTLAHLEERERVRIEGVWADDRRFGMQVKVRVAESVPPSGDEALIAYLRRVKHIGIGRAARLLERYGDDVLFAIDEDPVRRVPRRGAEPEAHQRGDPLVERACAPPARCTCCSRRTAWRGWCRGSRPSTATARTTSSAAARTS